MLLYSPQQTNTIISN